jgi:protein-tyrosine kinase
MVRMIRRDSSAELEEDSLLRTAPNEVETLDRVHPEEDIWDSLGDPELRNTIRRICLLAGWTRVQAGLSRSMAVTSAREGEGRSFIAEAIAISTALDLGRNVLLIDCNLQKPAVQDDFGLVDSPGLGEVLSSAGDLTDAAEAAIQPSGLRYLSLLPAGEFASNPSRLIRSPRMSELLRLLSHSYAFIILDLPAVLAHSDTAVLAGQTDGVVLVVESGQTEQRALQHAVRLLSGATIHGVVLNRQQSKIPRFFRGLLGL